GIVDQYLANKLKEAVDVAVQLKYDRIREEAHTENQQFLDLIDEGMKKVIKEQVKKEVSKITPKIKKLVNEQLESEVLMEQTGGPKEEPSAETDRGSKRRRSGKEPESTSAPRETTTTTAGKTTTTGSKTHKQSASQSAPVEETMQTTDVFEAPAHKEFETGVHDAHVKGDLLVMMKNSQSVNLLIFISNTLIEIFKCFWKDCDEISKRPTMFLNL
ncbi:hypothetical protein Tco_0077025, partial [Tanacetum coccineum]